VSDEDLITIMRSASSSICECTLSFCGILEKVIAVEAIEKSGRLELRGGEFLQVLPEGALS